MRPIEVEREPAIDDQPDRDVGNGERSAHDIGSGAFEVLVELANLLGDLPASLLDKPWMVPRRLVEHAAEEGAAQRDRGLVVGPVHPLLDLRTLHGVRGI